MTIIDPISGKEYSEEILKLAMAKGNLSYEFLCSEIKKGRIILLQDGAILRRGYTTGTCAAAAAKAAVLLLLGEYLDKVEVITPIGIKAELDIAFIDRENCIAGVKVDSGDHKKDTFNGLLICAKAKPSEKLVIKAGEGIGVVRKSGLGIKVGEKNIFPHVLKNIEDNLKAIKAEVEIEIFVPQGREIAKKTSLPELGIEDGIPIFGTTGFIEPYSDCYKHALDFLINDIRDRVGISTGRTSKKFAVEKLGFPERNIVVAGDYVLYAVERSKAIYKAIFCLPAKICDLLQIQPKDYFANLNFNTVRELVELLGENERSRFFNELAAKLARKTGAEVYVFDYQGNIIGFGK
ncbi:MAG: cobalt-precorrin-5B (C(1))-methyltransferase [Methanocellales archaeon]